MPKPLIELGEYPVLWHIMKNYAFFKSKRFILTLGYKGDMIIDYFLNKYPYLKNFSVKLNDLELPQSHDDWELCFMQTGVDSKTAKRLLLCKNTINTFPFMATYGDGVADLNVPALVKRHALLKKTQGVIGTITVTRPYSKYGIVRLEGDIIESFREKPLMDEYINVGYMVLEKEIFDYINPEEDVMFEDSLQEIAKDEKLGYYIHEGFWHAMDTYKDYVDLNEMWRNDPRWKIWND
jgi:glucose-1-phosphate cytidylyltransferase